MRTNAIAVSYSKKLGIHDEYGHAEKTVRKTTPPSHNRIFRERTEAEFRRRILRCCYGEADVHIGDWVYYIHRENIGTKRYPYIIEAVEHDVVKSIGAKQCTMKYSGDRPRHEDIIAVFIGRDFRWRRSNDRQPHPLAADRAVGGEVMEGTPFRRIPVQCGTIR